MDASLDLCSLADGAATRVNEAFHATMSLLESYMYSKLVVFEHI